ncbi:hypothetical protein MRB53_016504 [Persea americana]|uniref:Uncharacterized protein n=1 Tax=Persea americana TaxID=3435 RepID=A0ACC2M2I0_PERAE|nr:hypothetical protein MRB53_016504 [Persea americana]
MVIQEERVKSITRNKEEGREVMAFAEQGGGGNRKATSDGKEKQTPACTICKRRGHEAENCFQSIGYPDWWGDRPRTVSRGGRRSGRGGSTGGRGRGGVPRANVAQGLSAQPTIAAAQVTEDDQEGSGFSSEQWATLLNLLNSSKPGTTEHLTGKKNILHWIIDTGATQHMTCDLECLREVRSVEACPVGLPDGKHVMAIKEGTVILNDKLKLNRVLHVPNLNCNLISVSQLLAKMHGHIQFIDKYCVIQDRTSRTVIGAVSSRMGFTILWEKLWSLHTRQVE